MKNGDSLPLRVFIACRVNFFRAPKQKCLVKNVKAHKKAAVLGHARTALSLAHFGTFGGVSVWAIAHLASRSGEAWMVLGTAFYCAGFGKWHRLPACEL